jgi:hypothetical protein
VKQLTIYSHESTAFTSSNPGITQVLPPLTIKDVTTGLFSYSFFTAMALFIHKMREMSCNITDLNVPLLLNIKN